MTINIQHLMQVLFGTKKLEDVSVGELRELVEEFPSFNAGHYLLSKKLHWENDPGFISETQRTSLYFTNPFWLNYLLSHHQSSKANNFQAGHVLEPSMPEAMTATPFIGEAAPTFESKQEDNESATARLQPMVADTEFAGSLKESQEDTVPSFESPAPWQSRDEDLLISARQELGNHLAAESAPDPVNHSFREEEVASPFLPEAAVAMNEEAAVVQDKEPNFIYPPPAPREVSNIEPEAGETGITPAEPAGRPLFDEERFQLGKKEPDDDGPLLQNGEPDFKEPSNPVEFEQGSIENESPTDENFANYLETVLGQDKSPGQEAPVHEIPTGNEIKPARKTYFFWEKEFHGPDHLSPVPISDTGFQSHADSEILGQPVDLPAIPETPLEPGLDSYGMMAGQDLADNNTGPFTAQSAPDLSEPQFFEVKTHPADDQPPAESILVDEEATESASLLLLPEAGWKEEPKTENQDWGKELSFEPYHTIDYFASQGIRFVQDDYPTDKFGKQLKSFTAWLKTMKRLQASELNAEISALTEATIKGIAEHSLDEKEVVTEAMAKVLALQGQSHKAIELYQKLSLQNPAKSAYFAACIAQIKSELT